MNMEYPVTPVAKNESIVRGDKYRFTILTSRLVRIEYSEDGKFEDRATQIVINRDFEPVKFTVTEEKNILKVTTEDIQIIYFKGKPFTKHSLSIRYIGKNQGANGMVSSSEWRFGTESKTNLFGTARTLDDIDGEIPLEEGIMSMGELTVLDDSKSVAINEDGWLEPRKEDCIDQYLFCYGLSGENHFDYKKCLSDFYKLTGKTPLLPRYALGNWWSRYHAYTQKEYLDLMQSFKEADIPFSVAVIDMDWHLVNIDPKYGTGWSGYTWNEELFPNHVEFLNDLHKKGFKVGLNLHPNGGVGAHEKAYPEMAKAMGVDPKGEQNIEFDITDRKFVDSYFEILHHPLEKEGVDFWWMDWQQGNTTNIEGLDPLWMLNHLHTIDSGRNNNRAIILSRYSGPGSHRYPIGFSGDTHITWNSLDFQPYFTANASNIGYTWWSHDIGGHMKGARDEELITRWYQYGVFSPINRLHSSNQRFVGKEPWKYNAPYEASMKKFLKLRHELLPYIYTMNYHTYKYDEPLVQPLYYNYHTPESYEYKNEYSFGSEMLVSPITKPHDSTTMLASTPVYLPEGLWYDFFNNRKYTGSKRFEVYRTIYDMPVFVKAGGIVPMAEMPSVDDIDNPVNMRIKVFCGESNEFTLYEDDGLTDNYKNGAFATTKMELLWNDKKQFVIYQPEGDMSVIPQSRNYIIEFIGIDNTNVKLLENGKHKDFAVEYNDGVLRLTVSSVIGKLEAVFNENVSLCKNDTEKWLSDFLEHTYTDNWKKDDIYNMMMDKTVTLDQQMIWLEYSVINDDMRRAIMEIISAWPFEE